MKRKKILKKNDELKGKTRWERKMKEKPTSCSKRWMVSTPDLKNQDNQIINWCFGKRTKCWPMLNPRVDQIQCPEASFSVQFETANHAIVACLQKSAYVHLFKQQQRKKSTKTDTPNFHTWNRFWQMIKINSFMLFRSKEKMKQTEVLSWRCGDKFKFDETF